MAACPAGQMPQTGPNTCVSVGTDAVPSGFEAAGPQWGFRAIVPSAACGADTRAAIGQTACQPIDDCSAPFPPSNATITVQSGATGAVPWIVPTIAAALAIAANGSTIAIDEGTYAGVVIDRDVNFVGRCASKVIVQSQSTNDHGIGADGPYKVSVRSVGFQGFNFAIWVGGGSNVTVQNSVFSLGQVAAWVTTGGTLQFQGNLVDSTPSIMVDGVLVADGGQATVSDTEFRDIHIALDAFGRGARATGSRLVVSERSPEFSALLIAAVGGEVDVDHSRLEAFQKSVGAAEDTDVREPGKTEGGTLHVSSSELVRTFSTDPSGLDVSGGSSLELAESTLAYRARIAVSAEYASNVTVTRSVIRPVDPSDPANHALGSAFVVNDGTRLAVEESAILRPGQSAILASNGCQITLDRSLIQGTWEFARTDLTTRLGIGQAISLSGNASLVMTDSTLEDNAGVSIWMSNETASIQVLRSAILDTRDPKTSTSTAGLLAWGGTVDVEDSLVQGIPDTAIAIGQAMGVVSHTILGKSSVGFRMMGDSRLVQVKDASLRPSAGKVLSRENVLIDMASAEQGGTLPLGGCRCPDAGAPSVPDAAAP